MKVNSEHLYEYINNLATDEKVKFKVYYDDYYVTEIYWNGESFEWDTGTFTSEAFFNPLYDFEVIEEDKKIEKLTTGDTLILVPTDEIGVKVSYSDDYNTLANKINEIIDKINKEDK